MTNKTLVPQFLYHATYKRFLESIKEHGLGGRVNQKAWEDSIDNVVCFAHDEYEAESYAESADITEDDETLLDEIIILEIDVSKLNLDLFQLDQNVLSEDGTFDDGSLAPVEYHGIVPFDCVNRIIERQRG